MVRRMNRWGGYGSEHDESRLCAEHGCTPVEPETEMMQGPEKMPFTNTPWPCSSRHHGLHERYEDCDNTPPCTPVTDADSEEPTVPVPEFTIEVKYMAGTAHPSLNQGLFQPGWKYVIRWRGGPANGALDKVEYKTGYPTEAEAKSAAEERATEIAKAERSVTTYKFTPTLGS